METHYEFEEPSLISVFSVGVPGKRTFFLALGEKAEWLRLWLEKEHLEAFSIAIVQFFTRLSQEFRQYEEESDSQSTYDGTPSGMPSGEFEIDQIGIGFDQEKGVFEFVVHSLGPQKLDEVFMSCRIALDRIRKLGIQARDICAAGRPRCKLCGQPIDPTGHNCPVQN